MSDTAGLYLVIGAVIGAVGAQLTPIIQAVIKSRARRARAAADEAAANEAKRRPLYEKLISATHRAQFLFVELIKAGLDDPDPHLFDRYSASANEIADEIYTTATSVRIDGSPRARSAAEHLRNDLAYYMARLPLADEYLTQQVTPLIHKLKKAEEDLIEAAQRDFGDGIRPAARRSFAQIWQVVAGQRQ